MLVNPEMLRALAGQVDRAAGDITAADVGTAMSTAADGLPGSTTQWAARSVGEHFGKVADELAENVAELGRAVRGAGDAFEVTDEELSRSLDGVF
jgi:uncharacterized protein YukE